MHLVDRVRTPGGADEHPGGGQHDVARVGVVAERAPACHLARVEDGREVDRAVELAPALEVQQVGRGRREERGVRHRRHRGRLPDEVDVPRGAPHLEVADEERVGRSPEGAVLGLVDRLEQVRLVERGGAGEVALDLLAVAVEHPHPHRAREVVLGDELVQAAPGRLELLHLRVMQDLVDLVRDEAVEGRDPLRDGPLRARVHPDALVERLGDEALEHRPRPRDLVLLAGEAPLGEDPVQDPGFRRRPGGRLLSDCAHWSSPSPCPSPSSERSRSCMSGSASTSSRMPSRRSLDSSFP